MKSVAIVYGTRPEAVKVAPVIKHLQQSSVLKPFLINTGQHTDMLQQVNDWFDLTPDVNLHVFHEHSSLSELSARILTALDPVLMQFKPDAVMVQGDTTSVAIGALTAFYREIPVVHLEAGLRSGDIHSPFPEEANRRITGQLSELHLAPTPAAQGNLVREGVDPSKITVTGNTVIDALHWTSKRPVTFTDDRLNQVIQTGRRILLLTTHRRENWGEPMKHVGRAVAEIARKYPDLEVVFPAHRNPLVRESVAPAFEGLSNVLVMDPLSYPEFVAIQKHAYLVLTDSGGVQEEAPGLGKPVLVLRENTERPEAVEFGTARLVGTDTQRIVAETSRLLDDPQAYQAMANAVNPYGDGRAAERCVGAIAQMLGVGTRLPDFDPRRL